MKNNITRSQSSSKVASKICPHTLWNVRFLCIIINVLGLTVSFSLFVNLLMEFSKSFKASTFRLWRNSHNTLYFYNYGNSTSLFFL